MTGADRFTVAYAWWPPDELVAELQRAAGDLDRTVGEILTDAAGEWLERAGYREPRRPRRDEDDTVAAWIDGRPVRRPPPPPPRPNHPLPIHQSPPWLDLYHRLTGRGPTS